MLCFSFGYAYIFWLRPQTGYTGAPLSFLFQTGNPAATDRYQPLHHRRRRAALFQARYTRYFLDLLGSLDVGVAGGMAVVAQ